MKPIPEFRWIEDLLKTQVSGRARLSIGDDVALVENGGEFWAVTTDTLVDGVHYKSEWSAAKDLGFKSLAVNISDLACKGIKPNYALLNLASPELKPAWTAAFIEGLTELARLYNIEVIGGDTVYSPIQSLSLTLLGRTDGNIPLRSRAQIGDILVIHGGLGNSAAGLHALKYYSHHQDADTQWLIEQHLKPPIHLGAIEKLVSRIKINASLDLSDDLVSSCFRLCESSGHSIRITDLPLPSPQLKNYCARHALNLEAFQLFGGEDYSVLMSLSTESLQASGYTKVGEVCAQASQDARVSFLKNGVLTALDQSRAFQHFS
jgi:thiamine-monophosphate kinase